MELARPNAGWQQQQSLDSAGQYLNSNHIFNVKKLVETERINLFDALNKPNKTTKNKFGFTNFTWLWKRNPWANNNFTQNLYTTFATIPKHFFQTPPLLVISNIHTQLLDLLALRQTLKWEVHFTNLKPRGQGRKTSFEVEGEGGTCGERAVCEEWEKRNEADRK